MPRACSDQNNLKVTVHLNAVSKIIISSYWFVFTFHLQEWTKLPGQCSVGPVACIDMSLNDTMPHQKGGRGWRSKTEYNRGRIKFDNHTFKDSPRYLYLCFKASMKVFIQPADIVLKFNFSIWTQSHQSLKLSTHLNGFIGQDIFHLLDCRLLGIKTLLHTYKNNILALNGNICLCAPYHWLYMRIELSVTSLTENY